MDLRVWVGCLACYNAGRLTGEWMDAADANDWKCPVDPAHDEHQCLDHEIPWINHEPGQAEAVEWAEAVAGVEDDEAEAFTLFAKIQNWRTPSDVNLDTFRDAYCGRWESAEAHAWELVDDLDGDTTKAPPYFMYQFDEIAWQGDHTYEDGHVFRNH